MNAALDNGKIVLSKNGSDNGKIHVDFAKLKKAVYLLRSLDHSIRKDIIALLDDNDRLTVTDIYIKLRIEQSVASQHLAILRKAEIVQTQREGKYIHYFLNRGRLVQILEWINSLHV